MSKKEIKNIFSFGGGVQSVTALILAANKKIDYQLFLFANVGNDSENPNTLDYFYNIALPYAKNNNIELIELDKKKKDGSQNTIYRNLLESKRSIIIPVRLQNGAFGKRGCTWDYKIEVISRYILKNIVLDEPINLGLGITTDEFHRMRNKGVHWYLNPNYPLIDLNLSRNNCIDIIKAEGLPIPDKSSCWFCPFKNYTDWDNLSIDLLNKVKALEVILNERRKLLGKDEIKIIADNKEFCESGFCLT